MIKLTEDQLKHYDSIKWLLSLSRHKQTGRSYLLAVVYISEAVENPNEAIIIRDHSFKAISDELLEREIKKILLEENKFNEFVFYCEKSPFYFYYTGKKDILYVIK